MALAMGPANTDDLTPLMKQYWELKNQVPDALLLFRMGDFYEVFADDAIEASRILEITLTSRDKGKENAMPMAGVPHHSVQGYIQRLLDNGKKVAIGEQTEDPTEAKKRGAKSIVRREIVRVFTPAVQFGAEGSQTAYLATAIPCDSKSQPQRYVLACIDASTGETRLSLPCDEKTLFEEAQNLPIRHFLRIGHSLPESVTQAFLKRTDVLFEDVPSNRLSMEQAREQIQKQYDVGSLEAFLESGSDLDTSTMAIGHLLSYILKTQKTEKLSHLKIPTPLHASRTLKYGPRTIQHLDLLPSQDAMAPSSLFDRINQTKSSLGARQLKRWIEAPLRTSQEIEARQTAIRELGADVTANDKLRAQLGSLYDLERILARINTGLASPRDTRALGQSLALLAGIESICVRYSSPMLKGLKERIRDAKEKTSALATRILSHQKEDAPLISRDAGIFNRGTNAELDRLIDLTENGEKWLIDLEAKERESTGISSLKVRYNRVFGYYIEVTSANLKSVPAHYQRKQTTVGGERFFTEELKKFEDEIVSASDKQRALEQALFNELLIEIQNHAKPITEAASSLAEIDALVSLSRLAWESGWNFPEIDHSMDLEIEAGRHPLVDQGRGSFIPNNLSLSSNRATTLLITGPNMGGKSTIMRQAAVIVILGQIGAPVPATRARWGVVSSIYTRIGAHDAIAKGQSTFMVEMTELAHILHHADQKSLVVLDEIGRGTSTFDGISVAWSALEWIITKLGCRTLFATHYHELTKLPNFLPRTANAHMAVDSGKGKLRFLYTLKDGPANESFGIQVAKLAGLPTPVIQRAWKVLAELEGNSETAPQMSLFGGGSTKLSTEAMEAQMDSDSAQLQHEILDDSLDQNGLATGEVLHIAQTRPAEPDPTLVALAGLRTELSQLDLNSLTPIQALTKLSELQERARK